MKKHKYSNGITLIELVITLGLIGIIIALAFSFFFTNRKTLNKVEIKSDLQYEAKVLLESISRNAMSAVKVEYGKNGEELSLIKFTLIPDTEDEAKTAEYNIEGSKIYLTTEKEDGSNVITNQEICTNLKEVKVSESKSNSMDIELILEYKGIEYSINESYLFRNGSK